MLYLVNVTGLAGIVNRNVYKAEPISTGLGQTVLDLTLNMGRYKPQETNRNSGVTRPNQILKYGMYGRRTDGTDTPRPPFTNMVK